MSVSSCIDTVDNDSIFLISSVGIRFDRQSLICFSFMSYIINTSNLMDPLSVYFLGKSSVFIF